MSGKQTKSASVGEDRSKSTEAGNGNETDDDSEEEEEPKLKYERITGDLREILRRDGASCIAVNSKLLIIGTNWGCVHVLDHQGNKVRQFAPHSGPVTMIDMDVGGDYIASCSHDRRVSVQGLYSSDYSYSMALDSPVRCVALDPMYSKLRTSRRFVVGDSQVTLYEKGFFNQYNTTSLCEGNTGAVRGMKWGGQFLAWATDTGVRVMDMTSKAIISLVKRDHSLALGCDQYPPHLCWQNERILLIGWGDSVKICRVRERSPLSVGGSADLLDLPPYCVEIVNMFTTDFYICGIAPLDPMVVVLAYNKTPMKPSSDPSDTSRQIETNVDALKDGQSSSAKTEQGWNIGIDWRRPQMRVLVPLQRMYEEVSKDVLGIRCYQEYRPANYHLVHLGEEHRFYIVCPQDVVVAKPRDLDDRIQWLLQHNKYQDALEVLEKSGGQVHQYTVLGVGQQYLDYLLKLKDYEAAARLCPKILGCSKSLWEEAVMKFNCAHQLRVLSPHLPRGPPWPILDAPIYQTVLLDLLQKDHEGFLKVVQNWPGSLYNVSLIINAVLEMLACDTSNLVLLRALAHLYSNIDKHDKALAIYLKLRHNDVFLLIARHSLYGCVSKHVVDLMKLNAAETLKICSQHVNVILPEAVVRSLNEHKAFLFQYLDMLYDAHRELSYEYHNQLVELYADMAPAKLMPLLQSSGHFNLVFALNVVQARRLNQETVYLLVRMGNSEAALHIVLEEEQDILWAVRICKDHSDPDLWTRLISYSLDKPDYIRELLNNMGAHVDPLLIIQCIPRGLVIPGLRDALTKIMHDYQLRFSLQSGYQKILVSDGIKLLKKQIAVQKAGLPVHSDTPCVGCSSNVIGSKLTEDGDLVVFNCRHVYHKRCLPQTEAYKEVCILCRKDKRSLVPT